MNVRQIYWLSWLIPCLLPSLGMGQYTGGVTPQTGGTTQSSATAATTPQAGGVVPGQTRGIPYYVDPSRFYYNRPAPYNQGQRPTPTYNYTVRPNAYYYGRRRVGGYYYYCCPTYYYQTAPGVTVHVGPFVPAW